MSEMTKEKADKVVAACALMADGDSKLALELALLYATDFEEWKRRCVASALNRAGRPLRATRHADRQKPIGTPGDQPVGSHDHPERILAEAERAGITYGKGRLLKWVSDNYGPSRVAAVVALVKGKLE